MYRKLSKGKMKKSFGQTYRTKYVSIINDQSTGLFNFHLINIFVSCFERRKC